MGVRGSGAGGVAVAAAGRGPLVASHADPVWPAMALRLAAGGAGAGGGACPAAFALGIGRGGNPGVRQDRPRFDGGRLAVPSLLGGTGRGLRPSPPPGRTLAGGHRRGRNTDRAATAWRRGAAEPGRVAPTTTPAGKDHPVRPPAGTRDAFAKYRNLVLRAYRCKGPTSNLAAGTNRVGTAAAPAAHRGPAAPAAASAAAAAAGPNWSRTARPIAGRSRNTVHLTPAWFALQGSASLRAGRQQHDLRPGNQRDRARHGLLFRRQQQHAEPERVHGDLRQRRADHGRQRRFRARQRHERAGVEPVGGPQRGDRSQQLLSVGQPGLAVQQSHRNADRPLRSDRHPRGQLLLCGHHLLRNDQLQHRHLVGSRQRDGSRAGQFLGFRDGRGRSLPLSRPPPPIPSVSR